MKTKLLLLLAVLASTSTMFAFSDPMIKTKPPQTIPAQVSQLQKAILSASYDPSERNSLLRYQRAKLYYSAALQHLQLNWQKQAIDDAQRGLRLLNMNHPLVNHPQAHKTVYM